MNEEKRIQTLFALYFKKYKEKKIVLYGVGPNTKAILDHADGFNIVGLMDSKLSGEFLWEKEVLSESRVEEIKPDAIIIIANPVSVKIIYNRIREFTQRNQYPVFDINGKSLADTLARTGHEEPVCVWPGKEELERAVDSHGVISFDIFDTLLMRKIMHPADVFELVEEKIKYMYGTEVKFIKERIRAERELSVSAPPTFDGIYHRIALALHLSDGERELWKTLEREVEKSLLTPRMDIVEIYEYAKRTGKIVYLTSDMYYASEDLEEFLLACGISGYRGLLVSSEAGRTKAQGLFQVLRTYAQEETRRSSEGSIKDSRILHIGDHMDADIRSGKSVGIDTFYVMSSLDMAQEMQADFNAGVGSPLNDMIAKGLIIWKLFENPFVQRWEDGRIRFQSAYDLAFCCAAPLITTYLFWMWEQVKENHIDTILFASRDGYLLKRLFEEMMEYCQVECPPRSVYFLTSRSASVLAAITNDNGIISAMEGYSGRPESLLRDRFHLADKEIEPYSGQWGNDLKAYIMSHRDRILALAAMERERSRNYAYSEIGGDKHRLAFVDMMAKGTCQRGFTAITGMDALGLYFFHRNMAVQNADSGIPIKALYGNKSDLYSGSENFTSKFPILEIILSSPEPTLQSIQPDGTPVYESEYRSVTQIMTMKTMQKAVEDYFLSFLSIKGRDVKEGVSLSCADWALGLSDEKYSFIRDDSIEELIFDNRYEGRDIRLSEMLN